ncbi:hypothetical protein E6P78_08125 [Streptomyces sp. A0958]|uniref:hypothetical protein n=1 Tax=Streptomyces sp. A0958 TaxID=2563101 RepID=UPI00109EB752|nr:hypothetical protein [Streptomyces sp. A0958]THA71189.1 hypothetical protein E6P78_08125 [Streptomyces sp. A0958]
MNHQDHEHSRPDGGKPPRTAADEVLQEAEEAETDVADLGKRRGEKDRDSEAGDALTPNEDAQEDADQPHT